MFNLHKLSTSIIFLCAFLVIFKFTALPDTSADTIQLTGTIRDFNAGNPADFQPSTICGPKTGLVGSTLGSDQKPTFGTNGTDCIASEETFSQWYNDVQDVNLSKSYTITLDNSITGSGGVYTYDNSAFFPIDNELFGNEGNTHNYHFTFELHTEFTYIGGENFAFTSDDDLWVFINNTLVADLGGVHAAISTSINLDNLGLVKGETYDFDLFFAERNVSGSHLVFQTGTKLQTTPTPTATAIPTLPPLPTPPPIPSPSLQPLPSPTALPTLPPIPTPTIQPFPSPTLPPGGGSTIFGFVNDFEDNALKGVTVTITGDDYSNSTETDADGYYEWTNLAAGIYTLTYEKEGYQTETLDITLNENDVRDLGTLILEEITKAKISGFVIDISNNPIESVKLTLKGIKTGYNSTTSSDADGFFEFKDLEADTYVIIAKKKGYKRAKQTLKLGDGEDREIEIEMKKTSKRITKAFVH